MKANWMRQDGHIHAISPVLEVIWCESRGQLQCASPAQATAGTVGASDAAATTTAS